MSYLGQIPQECRGHPPEYICASILCHIQSATQWTQEVTVMPPLKINSTYRFNTTLLTLTQYHLHVQSFWMHHIWWVWQWQPFFSFAVKHQVSLTSATSHLHQISQKCRGSRPEYICVSTLCHIHSATQWTQEVRQTSSDLHDVYCLFRLDFLKKWPEKGTC